ncbi:amidohydrolase family protein [Sulfitobacter aestuariivivens]|uniref:Amidohydrolase family protein n=1 Tax=Sulfitobacter aestuariivivens TaxID=2766981 RepID=A0A927HFW7_9RHOB|nr:amidohydrolase family protein [Sulfitobacter aestuariivivens]MBD3665366.1 amidohydrolase family protein [Sulfitobacter aestuariivivens]
MTTEKIIDAHHHLWAPQSDPGTVGYVWLRDIGAPKPFGDPTPIQRDYLLPEFLAEPAPDRLAGSVHVQCDPKISDPAAETAFIQGISNTAGHPIMIVGFADLSRSEVAETIKCHQAYPNLRGVRQIISHLPDRPDISFASANLLEDLTWRANFAILADAGLSFDVQLYPEQMQQAAEFLAQHPAVPAVIDHLGSPYDASDAGLQRWEDGMTALAALPHVHVKLGGYAMYFGSDLGSVPAQLTQRALQLFGASRVMFSSNFPVDSLHLTYPDLLAFVRAQMPRADHAQVFHDTAAKFYRFAC